MSGSRVISAEVNVLSLDGIDDQNDDPQER